MEIFEEFIIKNEENGLDYLVVDGNGEIGLSIYKKFLTMKNCIHI